MAKSPIPETNVEWPEYEYKAFPAWVGRDKNDADLVAKDAEEAKEMSKLRVYPKVLGVNDAGDEVVALNSTEEQLKKADVVGETKAKKPAKE